MLAAKAKEEDCTSFKCEVCLLVTKAGFSVVEASLKANDSIINASSLIFYMILELFLT